MDTRLLRQAKRAAGRMRLPGSKSISNRALLLAALAQGETTLHGVLDSDDTRVMRGALEALGVTIDILDGPQNLRVHGIGGRGVFPVKRGEIFLGNSGTSARSLAGERLGGAPQAVRVARASVISRSRPEASPRSMRSRNTARRAP